MSKNNLMEDNSVERFKQLAGIQEDEVSIGYKDFEDEYELYEAINKKLDNERILEEMMDRLSKDQLMEVLDDIATHWNVYYDEEERRAQ